MTIHKTKSSRYTALCIALIMICGATTLQAGILKSTIRISETDTITEIPSKLPAKKYSFMERADLSMDPAGFKIRGTKGWSWTADQYMAEIPVLSKYKMNFLMGCYISMFSMPLHQDSLWKLTTVKNEWWLPIPEPKKRAFEQVFKTSKEYGISYCFGIHPQLSSPRPADLSSDKDFEDLWQHYAWAQNNGVRWFSLPLDDVTKVKIDGKEHALFVNKLLNRLREKDKDAQMVFCPTYYHVDPNNLKDKEKKYYEDLSKHLDKSVYVFWTGTSILPKTVSTADAGKFRELADHRIIFWENYPVNDAWQTMHLAPITGRDEKLYTVLDGYMSNPMFQQNEMNRIPLFTQADYTYDPANYDPAKSIAQAIIHQTDDKSQQEVLRQVVELFSRGITNNAGIGINPVLDHFKRISSVPFSRPVADVFVEHVKTVQFKLHKEFPNQYMAAKKTLAITIQKLEDAYRKKYASALN